MDRLESLERSFGITDVRPITADVGSEPMLEVAGDRDSESARSIIESGFDR